MLKKDKYNLQNRPEINEITTSHFIRLVSQDAGFTLADTRIMWRSIIRIIRRAIVAEKVLKLRGLGNFYVKTIPPRRMWIGLAKKEAFVDESKRIVLQVSEELKKSLYEVAYGDTPREPAKYFDVEDIEDDDLEDDSEYLEE